MSDPYQILDLKAGASEEEIRKRYLELVRQFPPDRDPKRFSEIRQAYDELRDPIARMRKQIGENSDTKTIDEIGADFHRRQLQDVRISTRILLDVAENLKS